MCAIISTMVAVPCFLQHPVLDLGGCEYQDGSGKTAPPPATIRAQHHTAAIQEGSSLESLNW